ncbi:hypothetical protein FRC09_005019 [Ceratobasidium sp. 395]|nr:hypothetical protein FRC09_005019 [Ceratobasidium sp. 395]
MPNVYAKAFDRWKTVYDQFASTLSSFLAESISLDLVLQNPSAREWTGLEGSLAQIDTALTSFDTQTRNARAALGRMRNRSTSLVPITKLPAETILQILSLPDVDCILNHRSRHYIGSRKRYQPSPLTSVSATNKWFRDIAISTPSLWTHVDLAIGATYQEDCLRRGRAYVEHSGQSLLHVHIAQTDPMHDSKDIVKLMAPHAHRITSLHLQTAQYNTLNIILGLFSNIASCQIREFYLNDGYDEEPDANDYYRLFDGRLREFFRSLQIITVNGPDLSLDSAAFSGLTALKLSLYNTAMIHHTISEFRDVLAACPGLRVLSIPTYWFRTIGPQTDPQVPIEPVSLPELELLDLRQMHSTDELLKLLFCIIPSSKPLTFSVSLKDLDPDEISRLQDFVKQANVTRLLLEAYPHSGDEEMDVDQSFPRFTTTFPAVRELAISNYDLRELATERALDAFPFLHTLHLLDQSHSDQNSYPQLLDSSSVQVVYMDLSIYTNIPKVAPLVRRRSYPALGTGEGYLEWPIKIGS